MSEPVSGQTPQPGSGLRVARAVIDALTQMAPAAAAAVEQTIRSIGEARGRQIPLTVPDAPAGAQFFALAPSGDLSAPAVIYRPLLADEGQGWRVTALMDRAAYEQVVAAQEYGLFKNPLVLGEISRATGVAITNMGTLAATPVGPEPAGSRGTPPRIA